MLSQSLTEDEKNKLKQQENPMPLKTYQDTFEKTSKDVIEKSVKLTADVATDFITKHLCKPRKDAETQSLSMK